MVVITVVISKPSCVSSIVWSAFTRIFRGLVWAVGCFLPRASTLRMRLADDLGLVPFTTSLCGRLTADDDCFFRCAPCGSKCLVLRMPLRSRMKLVAHVVCPGSTDCVRVVSALAGTLRGLSWACLRSLGSCAQVAPRHGVRRAYLPTVEVSLLSVGLSMSPQRESSCRPYSCALSRT